MITVYRYDYRKTELHVEFYFSYRTKLLLEITNFHSDDSWYFSFFQPAELNREITEWLSCVDIYNEF